jgi:hypothetical protein
MKIYFEDVGCEDVSVAGSCEHDNEILFHKRRDFLVD